MEIFKNFALKMAHRLSKVPAEHKRACLHGHYFTVLTSVAGDVGNDTGWVMDFFRGKRRLQTRSQPPSSSLSQ